MLLPWASRSDSICVQKTSMSLKMSRMSRPGTTIFSCLSLTTRKIRLFTGRARSRTEGQLNEGVAFAMNRVCVQNFALGVDLPRLGGIQLAVKFAGSQVRPTKQLDPSYQAPDARVSNEEKLTSAFFKKRTMLRAAMLLDQNNERQPMPIVENLRIILSG